MTQAMRRQMLKRSQGINAEDLHAIARRAGRPRTEESFYPNACVELAARIADAERNRLYGPVGNRARNLLAQGMPRETLTNRHGESVVERADFRVRGPLG